MQYDLRSQDSEALERALAFYAEQGYLLLDGLGERLTPRFEGILADLMGVAPDRMGPVLDPQHRPEVLPAEHLRRMSRVETSEPLKQLLLGELEPLLTRTLGAFVHVSSDYHVQFKSGIQRDGDSPVVVDHGGFQEGYGEVQGIHLLHQDFCGASLPTSPSAITLWVPLNDCDDWTLRVFPGAHRMGLLHNTFLDFDSAHLAQLPEPVDIRARRGTGAIFHALMPHGSSNPAETRRVSCDLRFFPMTGFLPSEIHALTARPLETHRRGLERAGSDTLRAPFLEALTFLGQPIPALAPEPHSTLLWTDYLARRLSGDRVGARRSFEGFVNEGFGVDQVAAFERFFDHRIHLDPLLRLRERVSALEPTASELGGIDRRIVDALLEERRSDRGVQSA